MARPTDRIIRVARSTPNSIDGLIMCEFGVV